MFIKIFTPNFVIFVGIVALVFIPELAAPYLVGAIAALFATQLQSDHQQ